MVSKKHALYRLEKKRGSLLAIGFMFSLFVVLTAMEWTTVKKVRHFETIIVDRPDEGEYPPYIEPPEDPKEPEDSFDETAEATVDGEGEELEEEEEKEAHYERDTISIPWEPEDDDGDPPPPQPPKDWAQDMPSFKGGEKARIAYLEKHVKFDRYDVERGLSGKVYVSFIVSPKGKIQRVELRRGIGGKCDDAVIKAVKGMPRWSPGRDGGKYVAVRMNMSFEFKVE